MSVDFANRKLPDLRLAAVLLLVHLTLPVGVWFTYRIGRPRFFGLALYLVVAVLLADVLLLLDYGHLRQSFVESAEPAVVDSAAETSLVLDWRFSATLLSFNVAILAVVGSGVPFYTGMTVLLVVLLYRIYSLGQGSSSIGLELSLIVGSSLTVLASQVLKVPYYLRVADTVNHVSTIMVLVREGTLAAINSGVSSRYFFFSVFHIVSGVGTQFSALQPRLYTAIQVALVFQIALLGMYLFSRYLTGNRSLALIATILLSINIAFLNYGTITHYQSFSIVLFCVFLFLLFRGVWTSRAVTVTVLVSAAWLGSHHVSVLMALFLVGPVVGYLWFRSWYAGERYHWSPTALVFLTVCLMFVAYWAVITLKFQEVLVWVLDSSAAASGIPSVTYLAQTYTSPEILLSRSIPFFVDSLHYAFLLGLAGVGLVGIVSSERVWSPRWQSTLIGFFLAAALYFPNPVWVPLEGAIPFSRFRPMVIPFVVIVPAVGIERVTRPRSGAALRKAAVALTVFGLVFVTMTSGLTNPGLTDLAGIEKGPREFLSNDELAAIQFVTSHASARQPVWVRSDMNAYIRQYAWAGEYDFDTRRLGYMKASDANRRIVVNPGLTVFSHEAFRNQGIKARIVDVDSDLYGNIEGTGVSVSAPVSSSRYSLNRTEADVIYSSGDTAIYYDE